MSAYLRSFSLSVYGIGIFHLILALVSLTPEGLRWVALHIWGATIPHDPSYFLFSLVFTAYVIGFAVSLFVLAGNPIKYHHEILVPLAILTAELLAAVMYRDAINQTFSITPPFVWINLMVPSLLIFWFGIFYIFSFRVAKYES